MKQVLKKMYNEKLKNIVISVLLIVLCSSFFIILFDNESLNADFSTYFIGSILKIVGVIILIMLVFLTIKNFYDLLCINNYKKVISGISENIQLYEYSVNTKIKNSKYFERKDYIIGNIEIKGIGINEITRNILNNGSYKDVTVYINESNIYIIK